MALSRNTKIVLAVGMTAAVIFAGAMVFAKPSQQLQKLPEPPPREKGLNTADVKAGIFNFETRNLDALNAVIDKMVADPNLTIATLTIWAGYMANYGLTDQEAKLRAKAAVAPKYSQQEIQSGITKLWEQQAKQGFW